MRNERVSGAAIVALAGLFCVAPAFGAGLLMINMKDGSHTIVWDAVYGGEAMNAAFEDCEGCVLHGFFRNSCAAYALDMDSANFRDSPINAEWVNYGYAVGLDSEASARSEALAKCRKMNIRADQRTRNCVVVEARCDTDPEAGADSPDTVDSIQSLQSEVQAMLQEMEEAARRAGSRDAMDSTQSVDSMMRDIFRRQAEMQELGGSAGAGTDSPVAPGPSRTIVQRVEETTRPGTDFPPPGSVFRDCANCPEMVVIPAGRFRMGCVSGQDCIDDERPVRAVAISRPFALSRHEVTFSDWEACVRGGGCNGYRPEDKGWGRGNRPVIHVSWEDAQAYVLWLSRETGEDYRLPSEAEWEYAARAGSETAYSWGNTIGRNRANCRDCGSQWDGRSTAPVGSFAANAFGLLDMHGNVWEWVEDCSNAGYAGAPSDGSAWLSGNCGMRQQRGGSGGSDSWSLRSAGRIKGTSGDRFDAVGFRVARTLTP